MKKTILILITLLFLTGVSEGKEVTYLQDRNGIKYEVNQEEPFSGKYVEYHKNGHGQKQSEENYKNGGLDGLVTGWFENGQKGFERNFRNGEEEGLWTEWYENGQKNWEGNYKNGNLEGLWTEWFKNGQKKYELHLKGGKKEGLFTTYDEEGSVIKTETYKDGELVK